MAERVLPLSQRLTSGWWVVSSDGYRGPFDNYDAALQGRSVNAATSSEPAGVVRLVITSNGERKLRGR